MLNNQQQLTFDTIDQFFVIAEDLVDVIANNINKLSDAELLSNLDIVEKFIEKALLYSETIIEDYSKIIKQNTNQFEILQTEMHEQIVALLIALDDCKNKLMSQISHE